MASEDAEKSERSSVGKSSGAFSVNGSISKMRSNLWIVSTVVLALAFLFVVFYKGSGVSGNAISEQEIGAKAVQFINTQVLQGQGSVTLDSVTEKSGLYELTFNYDGKKVPAYFTKDGQFWAQGGLLPLDSTTSASTTETPKDVPKSDKPKVELFVMSYCPYGTQMEKGILPVLKLLGNKIDAKIEFTHFTLHGQKEDSENFRQLCIREEQGTKFLPYLQCILNSTSVSAPADVDQCMKNVGIDSSKVNSCMTNKASDYYKADSALSQGYDVQGSPTLVVNGVQAQSGRSPASILSTICSAFNNAPSECSTQLASDTPSPGFGYQAGSAADSAAANCGV